MTEATQLSRADLHIHSVASDGTATVAQILDHVERQTDLSVIAITDHERIDAAVAALEAGLGEHWRDTTVVVATEFGRTVHINGTVGTDHGTGTVALLAGGALKGGLVLADWPGLAPAQLHEGRDLRPTLALDALVGAVCAAAFRLDPERTTRVLFPDSARSAAPEGLLRV